MRRVLILSYHFNQTDNIGSVRLRGLAKYLPLFGWEPVVITAKTVRSSGDPESNPPGNPVTVIEVPYDDPFVRWKKALGLPTDITVRENFNLPAEKRGKTVLDRLLDLWIEIFTYPDDTIDWARAAVEKATELREVTAFDAVISSSSPCTAHIIGSELKKRFCIPWIADFRDLWTQNHYNEHSRIRNCLERNLELRNLATSDLLTTVSGPLSEKLKELHTGKRVVPIVNGFDPDQMNPGLPLSEKFCVTYTGVLYKGKRDPEPLLRSLRNLIDEGTVDPRDIEVNFFGNDQGWLVHDVTKYHLDGIVKVHGPVPRAESIRRQREAQVLLLLLWNDPEEKGVYTGKIFDYLAARRPVLAIGTEKGVVDDLLEETNAGIHVSTDEEIREQLLKYYKEYKNSGVVRFQGDTGTIERYSHREMAKRFAGALDEVCSSEA